jgi:hypothetical protein
VAPCRLPLELEAECLEPLDDLAVAKAGEAAHQAPTISG